MSDSANSISVPTKPPEGDAAPHAQGRSEVSGMSDELEIRFTYHPPTAEQAERMRRIRAWCATLADEVVANTPASREQSLALTHIEEVSMWANAAIARREEQA